MKVDLLILQLAVIFLPGIVWARLDASYAAREKPSDIEFFLRTFIFGVTIYTVEFFVFSMAGWPFAMADLADAGTKAIVTRDVLHEVAAGLGIGVVLGVLWLYVQNYKVLTWLLQKIGATRRYGDEDVWDHIFNSRDVAVEYVHVRDYANQYVYAGWVNAFSETAKLRELVLLDVIVYDLDGAELYRTPRLYLARPPETIHIEFPYKLAASGEAHDRPPDPSDGRL